MWLGSGVGSARRPQGAAIIQKVLQVMSEGFADAMPWCCCVIVIICGFGSSMKFLYVAHLPFSRSLGLQSLPGACSRLAMVGALA